MKKLTSFAVLFISTLSCSPQRGVSSQDKKPKTEATAADGASAAKPVATETSPQAQAQTTKGWREIFLTSSPTKVLDLREEDLQAKVWGVLMDVAFPSGVITVMSERTGETRLCTSTGARILGGYIARNEGKRFVAEAEKHLGNMKHTTSFPYPEVGRVKFYVRTRDGIYTAEAEEEELLHERHALSPLFFAGNEILTILRARRERAKPE
jgi:hypothetical protein